MDSPAISPSERAQFQQRQISLWYAMLLTGVVGASYIPLAYWGVDGLILCVWLVLVGLSLLHEQLLIAGILIACGIIGSLGADLPLSTMQRQAATEESNVATDAGDLVILLALVLGSLIFLTAVAVWACHSMHRDIAWACRLFGLDGTAATLERGQFSISNLLGMITLLCVALLPLFYGGVANGLAFAPIVLAAGVLIRYRNFHVTLLIMLAVAALSLIV